MRITQEELNEATEATELVIEMIRNDWEYSGALEEILADITERHGVSRGVALAAFNQYVHSYTRAARESL